jgi:hypothetical protein
MAAIVVASLLMYGVVESLSMAIKYIVSTNARNQMENESRNCLSTITHFLQEGKANSTIISTPAPSSPPYSRIDFVLAADTTTTYTFYYQDSTVQMQKTQGGQVYGPQTLANHVTSLNFMGDSLDPTTIQVSLRLDETVGQKVESVYFLNQAVHMAATP